MQPNSKPVVMLAPLTTPTNGATDTARLDTLGYDYAVIDVIMGASDATTALRTLKVSEGATTTAASATDITELTGGTATGNFTLPAISTSVSSVVRFGVDCRARERYLFVTLSPASAHNTCVVANLYKGEKPFIATSASTVNGEANVVAIVEA